MPRRTLYLLPVLATATLLTACTGSTSGNPGPSSATGSSGSPTANCSSSSEMDVSFADDLSAEMTTAIQNHDGKAFVGLGATAHVRAGLMRWWTNISALGFTTGGAGIPDFTGIRGNTVTMTVGAHSALDSNDTAATPATPKAPAAQYKVSAVRGGSDCKQIQISSWTPIEAAPWDTIPKLYVRKTAHVVVAGDPSIAKQINRIAQLGEQAARWNLAILSQAGHGAYIEQKGYVVFVAHTRRQAGTWFRPPNAPKPKGWTADPTNVAGFEFPLTGVQLPPGAKPTHALSSLPTGGSRVVITPAGLSEGNTALEGILVHEFVHDIFRVNDLWSWGGGDPVDGATAEGAARWFEAMYRSHPAVPTKQSHVSSLIMLKPVLQSRPFSGRMPTDAQIYGAAKNADYYYDESATGFSYLAAAYGIRFAFQCVRDAYLQGGGPFGGVVESIKGPTITFEASSAVQARWARWVRSGFATPAPR